MASFISDEEMSKLEEKESVNSPNVISDEQMAQLEAEQAKYNAPFTAGLAGAARGATFGLSDVALTQTGLVKPQTLERLKEQNPGSSIAGEVAGVGASLFVPGSAVARLAQLGTKVAGKTAQKIGANVAESTAAKIAKKATAVAAGSAVEGAFYGTGQIISDSAIGRPPKNAEDIVATVGLSSLLGGGLGFVFKGFAEGAPVALRSLANSPIPKLRQVSEKATNAWADLSAFVSGADKAYLRESFALTKEGKELRKGLSNYLSEADTKAKDLTKLIKEQNDTFKAVSREYFEHSQPAERLIINEQVPLDRAVESTNQLIRSNIEALRKMREDVISFPRAKVDKLEAELNRFANSAQKAINQGDDAPRQIYHVIDKYKKDLDKYIPYNKLVAALQQDFVTEITAIRSGVRDALENKDIWGEAAARQEVINEAYNRVKTLDKDFLRHFGKKSTTRSGRSVNEFSEGKMHAFITKIHKQGGDEKQKILTDRLQAMQDFVDTVATGKPGVIDALSGRRQVIESELATLNKYRQTKWYTERSAGAEVPLASLGVGLATGILPAAATYGVYGALRNPARALRAMSWLEKTIVGTDSAIYKNIDAFLKNNKVQKLSEGISKTPLIFYNESTSDKRKQFEENLEKYKELNDNPEDLIDKISSNIGEFNEYAPETSQALAQKMGDSIAFLMQSLPKKEGLSALSLTPSIPMSDYEINKFARLEKLVFYPMTILEDLDNNMITSESVDVIRNLYPELYQNITNQFMQALMNDKDIKVDYQKRLSLSILLGNPLDNSLNPRFIASMQQVNTISRIENENKQANQKINSGQLAKSKFTGSLTTPFQSSMDSV